MKIQHIKKLNRKPQASWHQKTKSAGSLSKKVQTIGRSREFCEKILEK